MWIKGLIVALLLAIIVSLFTAFYRLVRPRREGEQEGVDTGAVKALTVRVVLSIGAFLILMAGFYWGLLTRH